MKIYSCDDGKQTVLEQDGEDELTKFRVVYWPDEDTGDMTEWDKELKILL